MYYAKKFLKMDKIDRLLDAMENQEHCTATEIDEMLQDPEIQETFNLLDKIKSSLLTISSPDVDNEWEKFKNSHRNFVCKCRFQLSELFSTKTVASIAIGIISLSAVAAIVGLGIRNIKTTDSDAKSEVEIIHGIDTAVAHRDTIKSLEVVEVSSPEIIVFDEETLETIINRIATYYGYEVIFDNSSTKSLRLYFRWNQQETIEEVVESLNNFEQISLTVKDKFIKIV